MSACRAATLSLLLAAGCTSQDDAGHALTLHATMSAGDDGALAFLSPSATIATQTPDEVIGVPYLLAVFPAGASVGNDPALFQTWGTVPDSLDITETTPNIFAPGPYDMVLVMYTNSAISDGQLAFEETPPVPAGGDLASFNLSAADVLPGDPEQVLGALRMNVLDGDVAVEITNRTPTDLEDRDQTAAAFERTILIIP